MRSGIIIAIPAAKDRLLTREMEMKELQSELKLLGRSHQHLRRELNDAKVKFSLRSALVHTGHACASAHTVKLAVFR